MNEKDLETTFLILKIEDINEKLTNNNKILFWYYIEKIIGENKK